VLPGAGEFSTIHQSWGGLKMADKLTTENARAFKTIERVALLARCGLVDPLIAMKEICEAVQEIHDRLQTEAAPIPFTVVS
jgi:hypothetical protein